MGADVSAKDRMVKTPLQDAAEKGHEEVAKLLLVNGAAVEDDTINGYTALHSAVCLGPVGMVRLLIQNGADVDAVTFGSGVRALHKAAERKDESILRALLAGSADINARTLALRTALHLAMPEEGAVRLLLGRGVQPDRKDIEGRTPLCLAALSGYTRIVEILLEHGGVDRLSRDKAGRTPQEIAAEKGHTDIVRLLSEESPSG
jgi:ankyrin repeat protein